MTYSSTRFSNQRFMQVNSKVLRVHLGVLHQRRRYTAWERSILALGFSRVLARDRNFRREKDGFSAASSYSKCYGGEDKERQKQTGTSHSQSTQIGLLS